MLGNGQGGSLVRSVTSGKCFSPTLGKPLSGVLLSDSWKEFRRKCKVPFAEEESKPQEDLRASLKVKGFKASDCLVWG